MDVFRTGFKPISYNQPRHGYNARLDDGRSSCLCQRLALVVREDVQILLHVLDLLLERLDLGRIVLAGLVALRQSRQVLLLPDIGVRCVLKCHVDLALVSGR